jgi:hypothetical protein
VIVFVTDQVDYQRAFAEAENVLEEKLACRVAKSIGVHTPLPCNELWPGEVNEDRVNAIVADFIRQGQYEGIRPYTIREIEYIRAALGTTVEAVAS